MPTTFKANLDWRDLNFQAPVTKLEVKHLARSKPHLIAQALGYDDAPSGVDGSLHGTMLPESIPLCYRRDSLWRTAPVG